MKLIPQLLHNQWQCLYLMRLCDRLHSESSTIMRPLPSTEADLKGRLAITTKPGPRVSLTSHYIMQGTAETKTPGTICKSRLIHAVYWWFHYFLRFGYQPILTTLHV